MFRLKELKLFQIIGCLSFLVLGLVINLCQLVLYICLIKINKKLFREVNYYMMYGLYGYLLFIAEWWSGSRIKIYCDQELVKRMQEREPGENAVIIMNHHYELDWLYCWMIADRVGVVGNCRAFIKDSLKYLPIIGWAGNFNDDIYIKRDFHKDQERMGKKLKELTEFPHPVWLHLFPEGTRYTEEKYKASKEFAKSKGLPDLEHHLVPRTRGFTFTLANTDKTRMRTIYDLTLAAGMGASAPPTLTSLLLGRRTEATVVIRKILTDIVPEGEEEGKEWMMKLFQEKDKIKTSLLNGTWEDVNKDCVYSDTVLQCVEHPPRPCSMVLAVAVNTIVISGLVWLLIVGGLSTWLVTGVVMTIAWVALHVLVGATKVKKTQ